MMAGLNIEDFNRLQVQLLDLREANCSLKEIELKQKKELIEKTTRLNFLEEENRRLANAIKSSKKASDVDLLQRDNENLRARLRDQEEDFRLQNNTLLQELSKLVGENENLEQQVINLCKESNSDGSSNEHSCTDDVKKLMGLRGELNLLEKKLKDNEKGWSTEVKSLRDRITDLNNKNNHLTKILKSHSISIEEGEINLKDEAVSFKKVNLQKESDSHTTSQELKLDNYTKERIKELEERLQSAEDQLQKQQNLISDQQKIDYINMKKYNEELEAKVEELKTELYTVTTESESKTNQISELMEQLNKTQKESQHFESELSASKENAEDFRREILNHTEKEKELRNTIDHLIQSKNELEILTDKNRKELATLRNSNSELTSTAESRKALIEEMKMHITNEEQKYQHQLEEQQQLHKNKSQEYNQQISELENAKTHLEGKINELEQIEIELEKEKSDNIELKDKLNKLEKKLESIAIENEEKLQEIHHQNEKQMKEISNEHNNVKKDLTTQLELSNIHVQELEDKVTLLQNQVSDGEEERKIHERKGMTMLKDLKKQLNSERKRADKLQDKLAQLLSDPSQLSTFTTLSEKSDDVSSVSSWSMVSGENRDPPSSANTSAEFIPSSPSNDAASDAASLLARVTELQQEKWKLEETISHLESSSSAMADDLLKKSAIIQHYCIENPVGASSPQPTSSNVSDKLSAKRLLEAIKEVGKGDSSYKEINRKLHCLLEETLLKNMHLHTDVDNLTKQVHDLSLLAASQTPKKNDSTELIAAEADVTDGLID